MDAELREKLLQVLFARRDSNGGWVPVIDILFAPVPVNRQMMVNVCEHLADADYIKWEALTGASEGASVGNAKITGAGVDVVNGTRAPTIDIRLPFKDVAALGRSPLASSPAAVEILGGASPFPTALEVLAGLQPSGSSTPLSESSVPAPLTETKKNEILTLKPTFMGISVDLKEAARWLWQWWKGRK